MLNYNPDRVLNFVKSLLLWDDITLKYLTLKAVTILALLSGHTCQSISSLTITHMGININTVIFYILKVIKNTTRLFHPQRIELKAYNKEYVNTSHSPLRHKSDRKN